MFYLHTQCFGEFNAEGRLIMCSLSTQPNLNDDDNAREIAFRVSADPQDDLLVSREYIIEAAGLTPELTEIPEPDYSGFTLRVMSDSADPAGLMATIQRVIVRRLIEILKVPEAEITICEVQSLDL